MIPTGELCDVRGTAFDFYLSHSSGCPELMIQLINCSGLEDTITTGCYATPLPLCDSRATVYEPTSGRVLEVLTTEPGLQFYTGNNMKGDERGRNGVPHGYRCALCTETQHFPDSAPIVPEFPPPPSFAKVMCLARRRRSDFRREQTNECLQ